MLYKNTLIKIKKSFGRYISLFIIVMVGVGFFAGLQATSPDMITIADQYYKDYNLMDYKIVSNMGLTDEDVTSLRALSNVDTVIPSYSLDVLDQNKVIRVHAIEGSVNTVKLVDGRMPKSENECIADSKTFKLDEKIKITSDIDGKIKNTEFTVVGTVESVLYLADDYGNTDIGDGKLSSFIFINRDNFVMEAYTEIYIIIADMENVTAYSKEYNDSALQLNDELVKIKPERENARYQEIYNKASSEINENKLKLIDEKTEGEQQFADAKAELDDNLLKITNGKEKLSKSEDDLQNNIEIRNAEFKDAKIEIENGWEKINTALTQYDIKKEELNTKINELDSAIGSMTLQLNGLSTDSQEYAQLSTTIKQYSESYSGLSDIKASIDSLTAQETELNKGIETFNAEISKAKTEIKNSWNEISINEEKLYNGYEEYKENLSKFNTEIADAQAKIDNAQSDLENVEKTQWYIFDRTTAVGYDELKVGIDVVSSVASILPFFFILIVLLMTSNSMARMIAEERNELGTLTSLGFKDKSIIFTYILYVFSASGLGVLAGFFIGCGIIPPLIYSNFKFTLPPLIVKYDMITFLLILVITLMLMALVTIISCNSELKQKPATLMRPVSPKKGQTILLEKIKIIWKHLSFSWKVTMRNIFRYKKRAVMTIVGVAGCTSFLLAGFGLRDSMDGVAQKQYGGIFRYDDMIILNNDTETISEALESLLSKEQIEDPLLIKQTAYKCESSDKSINTFLIVPENKDVFYKYFNLKSYTSGNALTLNDSGVIITQKLSEIFNADKGDNITIKDTDNNEYTLLVSDVAENYASNYIYMDNTIYSKIFSTSASYNVIISNHNANEKTLAENLINNDLILNVVYTNDILQKAIDSNKSLNSIVVLIVVVASLLAFIVLYNLTSINISERTREIATLKVLGFTGRETNSYIYREAIILTLISIVVGSIMGIFLHRFIVDTVEDFGALFFKKINWLSFLLASLLTMIFSLIMQIITHFKLQTINMIESLKSVE